MAKRKKQISPEQIPSILEKALFLIDKEISSLSTKDHLSVEESKNLISFCQTLSTLYKDYRAEMIEVKKELKSMSKDEIAAIIRAETN